MTDRELTERYRSDVDFARSLFDNGKMTRSQFDQEIEHLDKEFFEKIGFFADYKTSTSVAERILAATRS